MQVTRRFRGIVAVGLFLLTIVSTATAKYSGGTGEPNDPYQIATAADLITLGETPADYDKQFILTADIDLDPNLPGRKVFDQAVIAPNTEPNDQYSEFQGTPFTGVFDGSAHTISHLTITGGGYLGLFGQLASGAVVRGVGAVDVNITGSGGYVGGLVGSNGCFGDLAGGIMTCCYSTGAVSGRSCVGGLVGLNRGTVTQCYSAGTVSSTGFAGGLVADNAGSVKDSYAAGSVAGGWGVGGLVGSNGQWLRARPRFGVISNSYSVSAVMGTESVGGLLGRDEYGEVTGCFWDIETSGQTNSARGTGKTTAEMQTAATFLIWGTCGNEGIWMIDEGRDYPRLRWQNRPGEPIALVASLRDLLTGEGTEQSPYLIHTAEELNLLGLFPCDWGKHFKLMAHIDLSAFDGKDGRPAFNVIGDCYQALEHDVGDYYLLGTVFSGVLDGNGHTICHLTVKSQRDCAGLFSGLGFGGQIKNLGVVDVNIAGSGDCVGSLVGYNSGGTLTNCYCRGAVSGKGSVGGLVGYDKDGAVIRCHSAAAISGSWNVGGLVGSNDWGTVTQCYSTGSVSGSEYVAGLVGSNGGAVTQCYSTGSVSGSEYVGGLVGDNGGAVTQCYSTGPVSGTGSSIGGFVGRGASSDVNSSFWDTQTSGQAASDGGTGKTTAQMQTASTFLDAGWDFVSETANGTEDIWKIAEGLGYPRLAWEKYSGGTGEPNDPYLIFTAEQMNAIGTEPNDWGHHFKLMADIDLSGCDGKEGRPSFNVIGDCNYNLHYRDAPFRGIPFTGVFDGNGHTVSHLTVEVRGRYKCGGLFSGLGQGGEVKNLGVVDVNVILFGPQDNDDQLYWPTGGLVGYNGGAVTQCHSSGFVATTDWSAVGGLVGHNAGPVTRCYSTAAVSADYSVGGLAGHNYFTGSLTQCYSGGAVSGDVGEIGGLVGTNWGSIAASYSTAMVSGGRDAGGLAGSNTYGSIISSFWDIQTSGYTTSAGGTGKTTAEMQTASTFLGAGWDFVGETANGTEDIWWILEGKDYPRLWWETAAE